MHKKVIIVQIHFMRN